MVVKSSTESTISPIPLKAEGRAAAVAGRDIGGFPEGAAGRDGRTLTRPQE
ncbi:hypothetical protein FRZ44_51470 [Hypericibacter terrae]|uniref:Uncharacterized protein n=1 Tax=Hypericibacter terrae TaxID=2602015 RepID=A0A5J6MQ85_9PROT|nr:hypothetical protein FRZ44_51470 [Hypericibacter terrae]